MSNSPEDIPPESSGTQDNGQPDKEWGTHTAPGPDATRPVPLETYPDADQLTPENTGINPSSNANTEKASAKHNEQPAADWDIHTASAFLDPNFLDIFPDAATGLAPENLGIKPHISNNSAENDAERNEQSTDLDPQAARDSDDTTSPVPFSETNNSPGEPEGAGNDTGVQSDKPER